MKTQDAWAWWDEKDQKFYFIYGTEAQVRMCFGGGSHRREEEGEGKVVRVTITEIGGNQGS